MQNKPRQPSQRSGSRAMLARGPPVAPARPHEDVLAGLCERLVLDAHAPAAVLVNRELECLYAMGPTDRFLSVAAGKPTQNILAMARQHVRAKLSSAIQHAVQTNSSVKITDDRLSEANEVRPYSISVQSIKNSEEHLLLICFIEGDPSAHCQSAAWPPNETARVLELQSHNQELTALNSQLRETLERQRTTSNDLQNVLYSTDLATLFLDGDLNIRFFTPATRWLFAVIPGDIGRPISDLRSLAIDGSLQDDARRVLKTHDPIEKEIEAATGSWYLRRILPYMNDDNGVDGVVITFGDITERKRSSNALEAAKREAELANLAKSRFLAAASHDLRQPLQTLQLLQGLLTKVVEGAKASSLVARMDEAMGAMSAMLNTLLDINQIDSGTVRVERSRFLISDLLSRLKDEFAYHAQSRGLELRVVPSARAVHTDPRLVEQMLRNLISNALKYTKSGKVLVGCRHRAGALRIEVWDTGPGIAETEFESIFEEYRQLDNAGRERSRGLGLGLSIVRGLSVLLDHSVTVQSRLGRGSMFAIEIAQIPEATELLQLQLQPPINETAGDAVQRIGKILVIEDDVELRELLELFLREEGHRTASAADGLTALGLLADGIIFRPDIILSDFNLPGAMDGLQVSDQLRDKLGFDIPVVILTGDISTAALRQIAAQNCIQITKPVKLKDLALVLQRLLSVKGADAHPIAWADHDHVSPAPIIYVVDDDRHVRDAIRSVLEDDRHTVETYGSGEEFLQAYRPGRDGCLLVDAHLPGMSGIELLDRLRHRGDELPTIMITGSSDVSTVVQAMKAGASDFIEKPMRLGELLADVNLALAHAKDVGKLAASRDDAARMVASLTRRQRQIMDMVLAGQPSKNIAADLGISQRTVENHRASVMEKTNAKSLPALARLALAAGWSDQG